MPPQGSRIDPMQLMMSLMQMKQQGEYQQAQLADAAEGRKGQALQTFSAMVRRIADPTQTAGLARVFSPMTGIDASELATIASKMTPDSDVLPTWATNQRLMKLSGVPTSEFQSSPEYEELLAATGNRNLAGQSTGDIAKGSATARAFNLATPAQQSLFGDLATTGMTPGQQAEDRFSAMIPDNLRQRVFNIKGGLDLSAGDTAQTELGWANNRLGNRQLASQDALGWANLKQNYAQTAATAAKSGNGNLAELLNQTRQLHEEIAKNRVNLSTEQVRQRLITLKNYHALIRQNGGFAPDFDPDKDIDKIFEPGMASHIGAGVAASVRKIF